MSTSELEFDAYVASINLLAQRDGWAQPGKSYCDAEAWREAFIDGLTPEEAWAEERVCAMEAGR